MAQLINKTAGGVLSREGPVLSQSMLLCQPRCSEDVDSERGNFKLFCLIYIYKLYLRKFELFWGPVVVLEERRPSMGGG